MISIGCYFVFTICVTATILSAHDINDDDLKEFLKKIKRLHNDHRQIHSAPELKLDQKLSETANAILNKVHDKKTKLKPEKIGVNIGYSPLEENSKLDDEKATQLFAAWYNNGAQYVYGEEPTTDMAKKAEKAETPLEMTNVLGDLRHHGKTIPLLLFENELETNDD